MIHSAWIKSSSQLSQQSQLSGQLQESASPELGQLQQLQSASPELEQQLQSASPESGQQPLQSASLEQSMKQQQIQGRQLLSGWSDSNIGGQ